MRGDRQRSIEFVRRLFRNYYEAMGNRVYSPPMFENREFGYMPFHQKIMIRHLKFRNLEELLRVLRREAPMHVYRSAAIYNFPSAPMEEKGWLGAELIFDIDADHLELSCKEKHDFNYCANCYEVFSRNEENCPKCSSSEVVEVDWVCENCIEEARNELLRLLSFLEGDFAIPSEKMVISFSGNRGYHVAVQDENIMQLNREARQEIVEYITASNIDIRHHGLTDNIRQSYSLPTYHDKGWRGRIARTTFQILTMLNENGDEIRKKLEKMLTEEEIQHLKNLWQEWQTEPKWHELDAKPRKKKQHNELTALVELAIQLNSSKIDIVVTTDVHRLLRLSNTLNGKTGMLAGVIEYERVEELDPFSVFPVLPQTPEVRVWVVNAPAFRIGNREYGPYHNETVSLPANVAAYLICREVAFLA